MRYPRTFYVDLVRDPEGLSDGEVVALLARGVSAKAKFRGGVSFGRYSVPDGQYNRVHGLLASALSFYLQAGCPKVTTAVSS